MKNINTVGCLLDFYPINDSHEVRFFPNVYKRADHILTENTGALSTLRIMQSQKTTTMKWIQ